MNETGEAGVGKSRTAVLRGAQDNLCVAAIDQDVGHRRAERLAPGNREQMLLALLAGVLDQSRVVQSLGLRQDRTRHIDFVIERKPANDVRRRRLDRRQACGQEGARRNLDFDDELVEHGIEERKLAFGMLGRADNEQVGDVAQQGAVIADTAARDRGLDLLEDPGRHGMRRRCGSAAAHCGPAPSICLGGILLELADPSWSALIVASRRKFRVKRW